MKYTARIALLLLVMVLLTLATAPAVLAAECIEALQDFTIPDIYPLDEEDTWVVIPQENGTVTDIQPDGYTVTGTSGLNQGANFFLYLPSPATITHAELDVTNGLNGSGGASITVCYDEECTSTENILLDPDEPTTFHLETDIEYEDVLVIVLGLAGTGGSPNGAQMENLIINGTYGCQNVQPVHPDDILDELTQITDEETGAQESDITVVADANVYASISGVVGNVHYEADGFAFFIREPGPVGNMVLYNRMGSLYVEQGDTVEAGCIVGLASEWHGSYFGTPTSQVEFQNNTNAGDWHDWTEPSLSAAPCNQDTTDCFNQNPNLSSGAQQWNGTGASFETQLDEYVRLTPGQYVDQLVPLEDSGTFYVTVVAQTYVGSQGQLTVSVGDVDAVLDVPVTFAGEYETLLTQALSPTTPDFDPDKYTVRVTNSSSTTSLNITFICIHEGDLLVSPPPCFFAGSTGMIHTDNWDTSGGAAFVDTGTTWQVGKAYRIPNGDTIRRAVTLSAVTLADVDYDVTINYRPLGTPPFIAQPTRVRVDIVDPDDDDAVLIAVGVIEGTSVLDVFGKKETLTFTIDAAESVTGDLLIENASDELTTDVTSIEIDTICLSPVGTGGAFPGYPPPENNAFGLLQEDCTGCSIPADITDIPGWLQWLGCVLNYLVRCIIVGAINDILGVVNIVVRGIVLFGRWLALVIAAYGGWAGTLMQRLLLNAINIGIGVVNTILAWLYAQPFFQTILDAVSIVGLFVTAVWNFLLLIRSFIVMAFNYGIALLSIIANAYISFYAALTSPASYHIIPDCTDTGAPLYHLCLVFDVMVFFFGQVPMALVFMGLLAALIMLAQAGRALDLIGTMADAL